MRDVQPQRTRANQAKYALLALAALVMTEWLGATSLVNSTNILLQSAASPEALTNNADTKVLKTERTSAQLDSLSVDLGEVKQLLNNLQKDLKQTNAPVSSPDPIQQIKTTHHSFLPESNSKCIPWSHSDSENHTMQPFDYWMLHNPHWFVANETNDEFCIARGDLQDDLVKDFLMMYATQFYSGCEKVNWRYHWLSGWGATFLNMQAGLRDSVDNLHIPLTMGFGGDDRSKWHWNYAANKIDGTNKACPTADTDCYFLPHHNCGTHEEIYTGSTGVERVDSNALVPGSDITEGKKALNAFLFMTRKQLWLRRAIYDFKMEFKKSFEVGEDCSVIHVRRGDTVLDPSTRRYHPIKSYLEKIPKEKMKNPNHVIFLLTDDSNAIDEALEFYPNFRWKYFQRKRAKGSSKGWEDHLPSGDPVSEVITILATFDIVQDCSTLVFGHSNFAFYLRAHMILAGRGEADMIRIENITDGSNIFNKAFNTSEIELSALLDEMRKNKTLAMIDGIE